MPAQSGKGESHQTGQKLPQKPLSVILRKDFHSVFNPELEFLTSLWGLATEEEYRVIVPARQATEAGGIHSLESIPGLHKRLKIRALYNCTYILRVKFHYSDYPLVLKEKSSIHLYYRGDRC